jgi:hypothetical protein
LSDDVFFTTGTSGVGSVFLTSGQDILNTVSGISLTLNGGAIPSGSGIDFGATVLPEFTKFDGTNYTFVVNTGTAGSLTNVFFVKQPTDTTRGDFEDRTGGPVDALTDIGIPQIDLELKSETIVARTSGSIPIACAVSAIALAIVPSTLPTEE